jgi:hypothetical protein
MRFGLAEMTSGLFREWQAGKSTRHTILACFGDGTGLRIEQTACLSEYSGLD